ncbi:DUF2332 domain-containing protein [Rhodovibrionaceae bacterium A322]
MTATVSALPKPMLDAFRRQAAACLDLDSPFMSDLCTLFAERPLSAGPVLSRLNTWEGDPSATGQSVPLRLAGALHALVLSGRAPFLAACYPSRGQPLDKDLLWQAVDTALLDHSNFVLERLKSPPQTNEVRRSGVLLPGFLKLAAEVQMPLQLLEVGASAGLNLFWDHYGYDLGGVHWGPQDAPVILAPDWQGPPPPQAELTVAGRAGCDLSPLNPADKTDQLRLLSYIWADQEERVTRTLAALEVAAAFSVSVDQEDAVSWLERQLAALQDGCLTVVYHSIAWQYLPQEAQARGAEIIAAAGKATSKSAPLAWLRLEADDQTPGAGLWLDLWSGNRQPSSPQLLARADFHGRWIQWHDKPL